MTGRYHEEGCKDAPADELDAPSRDGNMTAVAAMARLGIAFAIVLLLVVGGIWLDYRSFLSQPVDANDDRNIVVEEGMSATEIVDLLEDQGLIDSPWYFRFRLWRTGHGSRLQPGVYNVPAGTTVSELVELLADGGQSTTVAIDFHPGTNVYELAVALHEKGLVDEKAFLARVTDPQFTAEMGVPSRAMEGYLMPGHYVFERGTGIDEIVVEMHQRFREVWVELVKANHQEMKRLRATYQLGDHELVTLASMVQEEAVVDLERPAIARVFFNRFDADMKLQSDPTCVYPPRVLGEKPSPERCHDPSNRWSTYVVDRLPPGPITNPGRASLAAVLRPYQGRHADRYLYFVGRSDGTWRHWFSSSFKEHQKAIRHYLKNEGPRPVTTAQPR